MRLSLCALTLLITSIAFAPARIVAAEPPDISWKQLTTERSIGVDWSPAGDALVSGLYETAEIILMDWRTGAISHRIAFAEPSGKLDLFYSARWSPDGHSIAIQSGSLYILDPETGQLHLLREVTNEYRYAAVDWSHDPSSVAALRSDGYIDIVALEMDEIVQTIDVAGEDGERGEGGVAYYSVFDWSPDGSLFAATHYLKDVPLTLVMGFWDRDGNILDVFSQETPEESIPNSPCPAYGRYTFENAIVQWANDSRTLAVAGSSGYGVCRLNIDGTIDVYPIPDVYADTLRWSPNQRWLAATHRNARTCTVQLSDASQDYQTTPIRIDTQDCYINALAWSPDSQHLAASTDRGIWIGTLIPPNNSP